MAGDIYLYLDGIPGESTTWHFENWIDVMSFSIGVSMDIDQGARASASGGVTSGQADPEDVSVDTKMSIASPVLLQCCASGAVIPRGKLVQCNIVGGRRIVVSEYFFGDSIISGVSLSASGGAIADESISINFGSVAWSYNCFDHFNPTKFLASSTREWSVIQAKVGQLDSQDNVYKAIEMARIPNGILPIQPQPAPSSSSQSPPQSITSYDSIFSTNPTKISFKPGPVVTQGADN